MRRSLRAIPLLALLVVAGCGFSPEDRVVGIYSLDPVRTKIPEIPGIEARVRQFTRNFGLKLRTDHSFVLIGPRVTEGTWRLDGDEVHLQVDDENAVGIMGEDGDLTGRIEHGTRAMIVERDTPLGKVTLVLRKTG